MGDIHIQNITSTSYIVDGVPVVVVYGLASDGQVYRWEQSMAKWYLHED